MTICARAPGSSRGHLSRAEAGSFPPLADGGSSKDPIDGHQTERGLASVCSIKYKRHLSGTPLRL
jgi:hypothetical protein